MINITVTPTGIKGDKGDPGGGGSSGGLEVKRVFSQSDLSVLGLLVIIHNFNKEPRSVRLIDDSGYEVEPDDVQDNGITTTVINLFSLQPLTGTWTAILGG